MFLIILLYALLASTFIIAKYAVSLADPIFLIGFRMTIAGTILLLYHYCNSRFTKKDEPILSWKDSAQITLFHIYIAFVFEFWALQYLTASHVTVLYSLTPFITALFSYFLLHERLKLRQFSAIVIGFTGVTFSSIMSLQKICGNNNSTYLPTLVLLLAVASAAYAWLIIKKLMKRGHSLSKLNGISMLYGGIASFITWLCFNIGTISSPVANWEMFLLSVSLLIITSNIIVYSLYGLLIQRYSLTLITFAGFLCPIFGSILDYICFGQTICVYDIIAIVCVTIGLYLFCYADKDAPFYIIEGS